MPFTSFTEHGVTMTTPSNNTHGAEEEVNDLQALANHAKDNPMLYVGGFLAILLVVIGTILFQLSGSLKTQAESSEYAVAMDIEDPMERMVALGELADSGTNFTAEALYMQGFAALKAEDYDTATATFTSLREDHPDFQFTPDGYEGIGSIHEIKGEYAEAIAIYKDIQATWPDSFAARRQPLNIGRCHELNNKSEDALVAYQNQLQTFPGSNVAAHAQQKLDQLRAKNPDLDKAPERVTTEEIVN
jgi:TolA-binding protein